MAISPKPVANCLSIDVEGFVESNVQSFPIDARFIDRQKENHEIERNVESILTYLDELRVKATFFILGRVARDLPDVVRTVASAGHEVGSHGNEHVRIFGLDRGSFKQGLARSKAVLEDLSGRRVHGFRAPDFSITSASQWALDVLIELGFTYDSSIYPTDLHDVYGIRNADARIHKLPNGLIEFPLATFSVLGKRVPFGGGGYFRLYPVFLTRKLIALANSGGRPCMFYIHPYELGPEIPRISGLSAFRDFRHYYNTGTGMKRLRDTMTDFSFTTALNVLKAEGFGEAGGNV